MLVTRIVTPAYNYVLEAGIGKLERQGVFINGLVAEYALIMKHMLVGTPLGTTTAII